MSSVLGTVILGYTMCAGLSKKILSHRAELPTFNTMTDSGSVKPQDFCFSKEKMSMRCMLRQYRQI